MGSSVLSLMCPIHVIAQWFPSHTRTYYPIIYSKLPCAPLLKHIDPLSPGQIFPIQWPTSHCCWSFLLDRLWIYHRTWPWKLYPNSRCRTICRLFEHLPLKLDGPMSPASACTNVYQDTLAWACASSNTWWCLARWRDSLRIVQMMRQWGFYWFYV